jgi:hypothetical protein
LNIPNKQVAISTRKLHADLARKTRLQMLSTSRIIRSVNLDEKIYAVRSYADAKAKAELSGTPVPQDRMCDMPGMDPLALSIGVKQFYATVLGNGLEFKFVDR